EREVEQAFLVVRLEPDPQDEAGRQRCARHRRFERVAIPGSSRVDSRGRADLLEVGVAPGDGCGKTGNGQRAGEVIVEVDTEDVRPQERALEMVPVVVRHEKLSTMARVVVSVRAAFVAPDAGSPVGTRSGLELANRRVIP